MSREANLLHQTIQLKDGRKLGFAQYGDPDGRTVFLFHGQPGNRLFCPDQTATHQAGVNLVVPDRPGYGLSTTQKNRTLLEWVDDVRQLIDALDTEQVDVIGYSAGGPYALACAARIPHLINRVMVISGAPPVYLPDLRKQMPWLIRLNYFLSRYLPGFMHLVFRLYWQQARRNPAGFIEMAKKNAPPQDLEILSQPIHYKMMLDCWEENLRVDSHGYVQDAQILFSDWGFNPSEITTEILLYWGTEDRNNPLSSLVYLEQLLPNSRTIQVENAGHFSFLLNWAEILTRLLA